MNSINITIKGKMLVCAYNARYNSLEYVWNVTDRKYETIQTAVQGRGVELYKIKSGFGSEFVNNTDYPNITVAYSYLTNLDAYIPSYLAITELYSNEKEYPEEEN